MLWIPQKGIVRVEHNAGIVGTTTPGTTITTGGTSSTKGTTVQLIAATAFDAYYIRILAFNYAAAATASEGALDILTGSATEEVLIPDLLMGYCGTGWMNGPKIWEFPLYIPAGSRISARAAGARTTTTLQVAVYLYGGSGMPPFRVGSKVTTYGMGTVPNGTAITPGASGAEGSWTQIAATTSEDHFALVPSFQLATDTTVTDSILYVDMGLGAATEEEVAQSYIFGATVSESMAGPNPSHPAFVDVPSGTRLVMRASNNGVNDAAYHGVVHGVS